MFSIHLVQLARPRAVAAPSYGVLQHPSPLDIQYAGDLASLPDQDGVAAALTQIGERPIRKQNALGIHGTLFYQLDRYKAWYPENREDAVASSAVNRAQRRLFGRSQVGNDRDRHDPTGA
jgi:hypothetical protein